MSEKISALPNMAALGGTELLTGLQGGVNSNATPNQIKDFIQPYKIYSALVSQSGTDDPVATVLENSLIGIPTYSRLDVGLYLISLPGGFTLQATQVFPPSYFDFNNLGAASIFPQDINTIQIQTFDVSAFPSPVMSDSVLSGLPIKIFVY